MLLAIAAAAVVTLSRQHEDSRSPLLSMTAPQGARAVTPEPVCTSPLRQVVRGRARFCAELEVAGEPTPSGPFVAYHDDALLVRARSGQYEEGHEQGVWREWYPTGVLRSELTFDSGQPDGLWSDWYEDGAPRSHGEYVDGEETGPWRFWHPDGGLAEQGSMRGGARDGAWSGWHPNGRDHYRRVYEQGSLLSWQEWDDAGEPLNVSD